MNKQKKMLLSFAMILVGCSGGSTDDVPVEKDTSKIEISATTMNMGAEGGTQTITFTSNVAWKASSDAVWCELSPTQGNIGSGSITLSVSANEEFKERKAKISISGGKAQKNVTLTQEGQKTVDTDADINGMPTQPL